MATAGGKVRPETHWTSAVKLLLGKWIALSSFNVPWFRKRTRCIAMTTTVTSARESILSKETENDQWRSLLSRLMKNAGMPL
jgi:hypothetical protein